MGPELASSVLAVFLLFFMAIADCAVNIGMAVVTHPTGEKSLRAFPYILDYAPEASVIRMISLAGTLLWCVGGLVVFIALLIAYPKYAGNLTFRRATLCISIRYNSNKPWWTVVVLVQNLLVALTLTFFEDGAWQSIYLAFVLAMYFALVASFRPYFAPIVHYCELASCTGRVLLMMIAPVYSQTQDGEWLMLTVVFITYGSTLICFLYAICLFLRFKMFQMPSDLETECANLEDKLSNQLMGDIPNYVAVADREAAKKGETFVWHEKLPSVRVRHAEALDQSKRDSTTSEAGVTI